MKKLLGIVVLGLFLITPSQADDIRDFQIEGMSIGDSLLDYFSESEIEKIYYPKSKKFARTFHEINNGVYEWVRIHYKTLDWKFPIYGIGGLIYYPNNVEACHAKQKEIIKELESQFPSARKYVQGELKHPSDPTGNSTYTLVAFFLDNGSINLECTDWSESISSEKSWVDNLGVMINTDEFNDWLSNEAR